MKQYIMSYRTESNSGRAIEIAKTYKENQDLFMCYTILVGLNVAINHISHLEDVVFSKRDGLSTVSYNPKPIVSVESPNAVTNRAKLKSSLEFQPEVFQGLKD